MTTAQNLFRDFSTIWRTHDHHPWRARWQRRNRIVPLLLVKLGAHRVVETPLFWGARMRTLTGEIVSNGVIAFGYAEPAISALLCELVIPGDTVVDIGTHFGYEAMLLSELVSTNGRVHAFEPNPEVLAFARANLTRYSQTTLHACALGEVTGRTTFQLPPLTLSSLGGIGSDAAASCPTEVAITRLDDALPPESGAIALIKCDAEGHEAAIVRGAVRHLAGNPALILETGMAEPGRAPPGLSQVATYLEPHGYRPFCFTFDGRLRVAPQGTFDTGHASTLFLPMTHARFAAFSAGWSRGA